MYYIVVGYFCVVVGRFYTITGRVVTVAGLLVFVRRCLYILRVYIACLTFIYRQMLRLFAPIHPTNAGQLATPHDTILALFRPQTNENDASVTDKSN